MGPQNQEIQVEMTEPRRELKNSEILSRTGRPVCRILYINAPWSDSRVDSNAGPGGRPVRTVGAYKPGVASIAAATSFAVSAPRTTLAAWA